MLLATSWQKAKLPTYKHRPVRSVCIHSDLTGRCLYVGSLAFCHDVASNIAIHSNHPLRASQSASTYPWITIVNIDRWSLLPVFIDDSYYGTTSKVHAS